MGRPSLDDEPALIVIHVRVTERQRAELRQVEAELGLDCSGIIRQAVDEFVGDYSERKVFRDTKS
jgi:hypothetical protein